MAKAVLVSAVPPVMLKSDANPEGLPIEVFDGLRAGLVKDRSQFYKDLATPFYGANRPGAKVSPGKSITRAHRTASRTPTRISSMPICWPSSEANPPAPRRWSLRSQRPERPGARCT